MNNQSIHHRTRIPALIIAWLLLALTGGAGGRAALDRRFMERRIFPKHGRLFVQN